MQLASRNYETQCQPKLWGVCETPTKNGKRNHFGFKAKRIYYIVNFLCPGPMHFLRLGVQQHLPRCLDTSGVFAIMFAPS